MGVTVVTMCAGVTVVTVRAAVIGEHGRAGDGRGHRARPLPYDGGGREAAASRPPGSASAAYLIALISSPPAVSPLSSQKNVPPRPCASL